MTEQDVARLQSLIQKAKAAGISESKLRESIGMADGTWRGRKGGTGSFAAAEWETLTQMVAVGVPISEPPPPAIGADDPPRPQVPRANWMRVYYKNGNTVIHRDPKGWGALTSKMDKHGDPVKLEPVPVGTER